jgi:hypothetical protein
MILSSKIFFNSNNNRKGIRHSREVMMGRARIRGKRAVGSLLRACKLINTINTITKSTTQVRY